MLEVPAAERLQAVLKGSVCAGDGSELPCEGSLPNDGKLNGFVAGSSAPAAFNAASFAAHMTRAQRAAVAVAGSAGGSPKAGAGMPQAFANGSAKRCAVPACVQVLRPFQGPSTLGHGAPSGCMGI